MTLAIQNTKSAPALQIAPVLDFGVIWKRNPHNGHFVIGLLGSPVFGFYGDWDTSDFMDYDSQRACKSILDKGGQYVLWPECEEDAPELIHRGELFGGDKATKVKGTPSQCHKNAAKRWFWHPELFTITTGYALSDDGIWRQHTWLVDRAGKVMETTVLRVSYYGFKLTTEESMAFLMNNG